MEDITPSIGETGLGGDVPGATDPGGPSLVELPSAAPRRPRPKKVKKAVIVPAVAAPPAPPPRRRKPAPASPQPLAAQSGSQGPAHLGWYWKVAASLAGLAVLVLIFVLYLMFARATITVTPRVQDIKASPRLVLGGTAPGAIRGAYRESEVSLTRAVPISGSGAPVDGVATGTVTLVNTTDSAQSLVATTRLLAEGGVLFRLKSPTRVPAGGRVDAEAYADKPGATGNIGPSKFTIPGLRESLQDDIYAVSTSPMSGGIRTVKILTDADVSEAFASVERAVTTETVAKLRALAGDAARDTAEIVSTKVVEKKTDAAVGTEASTVAITMKIIVKAAWYDTNAVRDAVRAALAAEVPADYELTDFDPNAITVALAASDATAGTAALTANGSGRALVRAESSMFDSSLLAGLTAARVSEYFRSLPAVESVEVKFRPFWIRRVPGAKDHITIIIKRP